MSIEELTYGDQYVLRIDEASKFLHLSRSSLYRLLRQGAIPYAQLGDCGSSIMIKVEDLKTFIDERVQFRGGE